MASSRLLPWASAVVACVALLGVLDLKASQARPIAPVAASASFAPQQVARGRQLAALGDCAGCHTRLGGESFAGGVAVPTPFGVVYGSNITPEPQTGIGAWSEEAFRRALREGVSRDGHRLYPAFPYDHFTHLTDDDIAALYAYLMTRDPVRAQAPRNRLSFPFGWRSLIAVWNERYLHQGPLQPPQGPPAYQRGAYLVEGLAHCAACHSPRDLMGAERRDAYLAGGDAGGWHATALDATSPSPVPWTAPALAQYLNTGLAPDHAMAAGPMQDVVHSLSQADQQDIAAIADYISAQMGAPDQNRRAREDASRRKAQGPLATAAGRAASGVDEPTLALGRRVYEDSCAGCHDLGRGLSSNSALQLPLAVALHLPDPRNLVRIIHQGIQPVGGLPGRWMPPFAGSLSDEQTTALVIWLRRQATDEPDWNDVAKVVKDSGSAP